MKHVPIDYLQNVLFKMQPAFCNKTQTCAFSKKDLLLVLEYAQGRPVTGIQKNLPVTSVTTTSKLQDVAGENLGYSKPCTGLNLYAGDTKITA